MVFHAKEVLKKAQRVQNIIRRNLWNCDFLFKKVKSAVTSTTNLTLVRPLLESASSAWQSYNYMYMYTINSLERILRQVARFCANTCREDWGHGHQGLKMSWVGTLFRPGGNIRDFACSTKWKNWLIHIPRSVYDYIQSCPRGTRMNNQKFIKFRHRWARAFQESLFVSTVKDWNQLPTAVVLSTSMTSFKHKLKQIQWYLLAV